MFCNSVFIGQSALFMHLKSMVVACTEVKLSLINLCVRVDVPVWQPAPVQPGGQRHLFQRIQVPPWAQGGEHIAKTDNQHRLHFIHFLQQCYFLILHNLVTPNQHSILTNYNEITFFLTRMCLRIYTSFFFWRQMKSTGFKENFCRALVGFTGISQCDCNNLNIH